MWLANNAMKCLLIPLLVLAIPSCALFEETVRRANEETEVLPKGSTVRGDRVTARVPHEQMYLQKDVPDPGSISLKHTEKKLRSINYSAVPIEKKGTLLESITAMNERISDQGKSWEIAKQTNLRFQGKKALQLEQWVQDPKNGEDGRYICTLVIERPDTDLALIHSRRAWKKEEGTQVRREFEEWLRTVKVE